MILGFGILWNIDHAESDLKLSVTLAQMLRITEALMLAFVV